MKYLVEDNKIIIFSKDEFNPQHILECGQIFSYKKINDKYDVIISNPPYVTISEKLPTNVLKEPVLALYSGEKGLDHIEKIFKSIHKYTNKKYLIALEINEKSEEDLTKLIKKYFDSSIKYKFEKDLAEKTRYLFIYSE